MQKGELFVTGTNKIIIPLDAFPSEVRAHFKDKHPEPVPCDQGDVDSMQYAVHTSNTVHSGFVLIISWSVSSVREIKWSAEY